MSKMPGGKTERHVKEFVKRTLDKHEFFWWMPPANGFGVSGVSDFCALKDGTFFAIETKANKNVATAMQKAYLRSIDREGGIALIVQDTTQVDFTLFMESYVASVALKAQGKEPPVEIGGPMLDALKLLTTPWIR